MITRPPISTLFPYTTLFRSNNTPATKVSGPAMRRNFLTPLCLGDSRFCMLVVFSGGLFPAEQAGGQEEQGFDERERSEEHTSELQSLRHLVCRLLLEKKKKR